MGKIETHFPMRRRCCLKLVEPFSSPAIRSFVMVRTVVT